MCKREEHSSRACKWLRTETRGEDVEGILDTADYCTLQPCRARLRMRNENIIQKFLSPFIKIHSLNNVYIYIYTLYDYQRAKPRMLLCFNVCDPPHPFFHPRESILPGRNVTIVEKEGRIPPSSCVPSADPRQLVSIIRGKRG